MHKATFRLWTAAQKARQSLSSDTSTGVKEDALLPGKDFRYTLEIAEFEEVVSAEIEKFKDLLRSAKEDFA